MQIVRKLGTGAMLGGEYIYLYACIFLMIGSNSEELEL